MRKKSKKIMALVMITGMILGSICIPMGSKAQSISSTITEEEYNQNPDDYIVMEDYDYNTKETEIYYMRDYPDDTPFPALQGSAGITSKEEITPIDEFLGETEPGRTIFGTDDRTLVTNVSASPYRSIVRIHTLFYNPNTSQSYTFEGSGFLVGRSEIVTAAHNVYHGSGWEILIFNVAAGCTASNPTGYPVMTSALPTHFHIPQAFKNAYNSGNSTNMQKYDYALIQLDDAIGDAAGYLSIGGYGTTYNTTYLTNKQVTVIGYPTSGQGNMYKHKGPITGFNADGYQMYYNMDTSAGQDGGPVILPLTSGYYVVGFEYLEESSHNIGRYITKNIHDLIVQYRTTLP